MKKTHRRNLDIIILVTIFLATLLQFYDCIASEIVVYKPVRRWSPLHFHFIRDCVYGLLFSSVLFWKAYRLGACVFTKIAVWLFLFLVVLDLSYYIFLFKYSTLTLFGQILLGLGVVIMLILYILRICLKRFY